MSKITFANKVAIESRPEIANENKVRAEDMNEIKQVVNENAINISSSVDDTYRVNLLHSKNLLPNGINSQTINGLTITRNSNGTLQINGTATAQTELSISYFDIGANIDYFLSGCPSGGGTSSYFISLRGYANDTGSGLSFNRPTNETREVFIRVYNGATLNNLVFKPMINKGTTATDYEPYVPNQIVVDNEKYTDTLNVGSVVDSRSRVNVLYSRNKWKLQNTQTINGITFTNNGNGTFNLSGTSTAQADFKVDILFTENYFKTNSIYTISKTSGQFKVYITSGTTSSWISTVVGLDVNDSEKTFTMTKPSNATLYSLIIRIDSGKTLNITNANIMLNEGGEALDFEFIIPPSIVVDNEEIYNQNIMNYSTGEIRIGTWIDGKPLYRKVVDCGALPNNTSKTINTNINNISRVVRIYGYSFNGTNTFFPLPHSNPNPVSLSFYKNNNANGITIQTTIDRSSFTETYITLEYTKTTD